MVIIIIGITRGKGKRDGSAIRTIKKNANYYELDYHLLYYRGYHYSMLHLSSCEFLDTYFIHVGIPTGSVITNILALEDDNEDYEVVIRMYIISQGDFAFSNKDGHSTFSFRIPSTEEIILKDE